MISFLVALGVGLVVTPFFCLDRGHRFHRWGNEAPRLGGIVVLAALLAGSPPVGLSGFWLGLAIVFGMGLVDDFVSLKLRTKFGCQVIAAGVFLATTFTNYTSWVWVVIFFVWIVGITNALNLLDNMDGLAPGVGAIAALGLASLGFGAEPVLFALAGALAGFLVYNFPPGRIYLGDGGSHLVGFALATAPFAVLNAGMLNVERFLISGVVLLVPIVDTGFVIVTRVARRVSPFLGGKDHISHRLQRLRLWERQVLLIFYVVAALLVFWAHRLHR